MEGSDAPTVPSLPKIEEEEEEEENGRHKIQQSLLPEAVSVVEVRIKGRHRFL